MLVPRTRHFWFMLIFITNFTWAGSLTKDWQEPDYIEKAFLEIALKNEYKKTNERVIKWKSPIYYQYQFFKLPENQLVKELSQTHLQHLKEITGHKIAPSNPKHPANLTILFTKDITYQEAINHFAHSQVDNLATESHCMGRYQTNQKNEITQATIIIPLDHAMSRGLLPACIVEEITQIMGLPNDSDWVSPSIANDKSRIELLTGLDYILLKLLYLPEIKAGMTATQIQPIIRRQLKRYQQNGIIQNAGQRVNQSGLYPLLN